MNRRSKSAASGWLAVLLLGGSPGCTALNPAFSPDSDEGAGSGSDSATGGSTSSPVSGTNASMSGGGPTSTGTSSPTLGTSGVTTEDGQESSETGSPRPMDASTPIGPYCTEHPGLLICQDFDREPPGPVLPSVIGDFPLVLELGDWSFVSTDLGIGQDYEMGQLTRIEDSLELGDELREGFTVDVVLTLDQSGRAHSSSVVVMREFIELDASVSAGSVSLSCGVRGLKTGNIPLEYDEPYHAFCSVTDRPTLVVIPLGREGAIEVRFAQGEGINLAESQSLEGMWIGGGPLGSTQGPFDGVLDAYRVWQRPLAVDEICALEGCAAP